MSRCFPFPPPGYEKKLSIDNANSLAKEKHREKEKKHKKDKDRSREKHRDKEKKEKKKHRDKDRDKNLEKEATDEKRVEGHVANGLQQTNHFAETSLVQELARRTSDINNAVQGSKSLERNICTNQKKSDVLGTLVASDFTCQSEGKRKDTPGEKNGYRKLVNSQRENHEAGTPRLAIVHNAGGLERRRADMVKHMEKGAAKPVEGKAKEKHYHRNAVIKGDESKDQNGKSLSRQPELSNGKDFGPDRLQNCQFRETNAVVHFGGRVRDEHTLSKSHVIEKNKWTNQKCVESVVKNNIGIDQKRVEPTGRTIESNFRSGSVGRDVSNHTNSVHIKVNGQVEKARGPRVSFVHSFRGAEQGKVEAVGAMEKVIKAADGKERNRHSSEINTNSEREERKWKAQDDDSSPNRREEKATVSGEPNKKLSRLKETVEDGSKSSLVRESTKISAPEVNSMKRKRKEPAMNGSLHDSEIQPFKLQRSIPSSQPMIENGRKLEPHDVIPQPAPQEQGTPVNLKFEAKEHKVNGITDAHTSAPGPVVPPSAPPKAAKIHKAAVRPPHPDSKHLSQILMVPKIEDWSEFDDQEWLFSSNRSLSKKPEASSDSGAEVQEQVWAKALHLKSANVAALPYVIPY